MIDYLQMKYFSAVAKERSFSSAAKRLFVSQQTISAHIAQIESTIGTKLFERTRPLTLTSAGECLLKGIQEILFIEAQTEKEINDVSNPNRNGIRIGVSHAYARAILPQMLQRFYESYPLINVQIHEMLYEQMETALLDQKVDFILTRPYYKSGGVKMIQIKKADDVLLYAPQVSLKNHFGDRVGKIIRCLREKPSLEAVKECPFIFPRSGNVRSGAMELFRELRVEPNIRTETDALETAIFLCRSGLGITLSPKLLLKTYAGGATPQNYWKESYPLTHEKKEHGLALCYLEKSYLSDVMKKFIAIAEDIV